MNTIKLGSKGPDVARWQAFLHLTVDGDFGPQTDGATKQFQAQHGLEPDGVVGPHTQAVAFDPHPADAPAPAIRPSVRAIFWPFTDPLEGVVSTMYLDAIGLVTVARGDLIDPVDAALDLPFVYGDGTPATRE